MFYALLPRPDGSIFYLNLSGIYLESDANFKLSETLESITNSIENVRWDFLIDTEMFPSLEEYREFPCYRMPDGVLRCEGC